MVDEAETFSPIDTRGQRYGFIRFGSRVDVYLPVGSRPRVSGSPERT
jgi:phosphatidylserine decarboxylase